MKSILNVDKANRNQNRSTRYFTERTPLCFKNTFKLNSEKECTHDTQIKLPYTGKHTYEKGKLFAIKPRVPRVMACVLTSW